MCEKAVENAHNYGFLEVRNDAEAATWPDPFVARRLMVLDRDLFMAEAVMRDGEIDLGRV